MSVSHLSWLLLLLLSSFKFSLLSLLLLLGMSLPKSAKLSEFVAGVTAVAVVGDVVVVVVVAVTVAAASTTNVGGGCLAVVHAAIQHATNTKNMKERCLVIRGSAIVRLGIEFECMGWE